MVKDIKDINIDTTSVAAYKIKAEGTTVETVRLDLC